MLSRILISIAEDDGYFAIGLWPLSCKGLLGICKRLATRTDVFLAVRSDAWNEGFHPPNAHDLHVRRLRGMGMASASWTDISATLKDSAKMRRVVDFLLYCPGTPANDYTLLNNSFFKFQYGHALENWGGYWVYLHDNVDVHFFIEQKKDSAKRILDSVFDEIPPEARKRCLDEILAMWPLDGKKVASEVAYFAERFRVKKIDPSVWWDWNILMA